MDYPWLYRKEPDVEAEFRERFGLAAARDERRVTLLDALSPEAGAHPEIEGLFRYLPPRRPAHGQ